MKDHFITVKDISDYHDDQEGKIGGTNANFSKHFGLKRIGAHYFKIPPGRRTSKPHVESLEEEFVYVISGEIDLWFNGKIKKMTSGDCVGFPIGTGVGQSTSISLSGNVTWEEKWISSEQIERHEKQGWDI